VRSLNTRQGQWRTLAAATHESHLTYTGVLGATYEFRVQAGSGPFSIATTVVHLHGRGQGRRAPLKLVDVRGLLALEGLATASRTA
jgi:hypothetical protein